MCKFSNFKIIKSEIHDLKIHNFQNRKLTISNYEIPQLSQSKKLKFTNLKTLNSETSHLQILNSQNKISKSPNLISQVFNTFLFWYWGMQMQFLYIIFDTFDNLRVSLIYEVFPKSIRPAFISSRQGARLASAGYECNQ